MGTLAFCVAVVTTPIHEVVGNAVVCCNTYGGEPPVQLKFTFVPARAMARLIVFVTVNTTAS